MPQSGQPDRCCDLVMKGGITSGILYPPAICRIAERFHLVGIGGTSAGAIAACAAAAAEYHRRQTGGNQGYERLERLPHDLAGDGRLLDLFRPDRVTRREFALLRGALGLGERGWFKSTWWKTRALWALLGHKRRLRRLVDNDFGICSGMALGNRPGPGVMPPLTEWLATTIDEIAGLQSGLPLTFGDLRRAPRPAALKELSESGERSIDLRAVTTCVSFGRPFELPCDGTRIFAFDEAEFRRLFPDYVVDYMVEAAAAIDAPAVRVDGKLPFPVGDAMPVVVAARMSLAFPGLFTMVPLYAVDYEAGGEMKKVWFSDGGITSNLPIHRFDALLPRWPTLAINLQYTDKSGVPARAGVDLEKLIYMINRREDGTRDLWSRFANGESPTSDFIGFISAVFRSAQVWHDNSFLALPGYRDRVVEIWLDKDEGGMNLDMPAPVIERLIKRGEAAGMRLRDRFAETPGDQALSWDGHRWVRLCSAMAGLSEYLRAFARSAACTSEHERTLAEMLADRTAPPTCRFKTRAQHEAARWAVEDLLELATALEANPCSCCDADHQEGPCTRPFCGGPRPPVAIGSRARM